MDIRPITEREWTGLTLIEANQRAEIIGYTTRVVEQDGNSLMLTMDFKSNRLNLRLKDGKIIGLYTG
jgi:hypothetical protein